MGKLTGFLLFAASCALATASFGGGSDGWTSKLTCNNFSFVVDGFHTYENGFTDYQLVIRNRDAISYFSGLIGQKIQTNELGELVIDLQNRTFDGSFRTTLADHSNRPEGGSGGTRYDIWGHWLGPGRYEVYVTALNYYQGMTQFEPSFLGKWVFGECY